MSTPARRFFFCHLQKTGGVSLLRRLANQFPEAALYPAASDGAPPATTVSIDHLRDRWDARADEIRVVCGHFPMCTVDLLGGGFTTFTVLRDPIERVLSSLRHYQRAHPEDDATLDEVYDDRMRRALLYENHMVRMLSLETEEMSDGMYSNVAADEARLARAVATLERTDVVGIQEEYDRFCATLEQRFSWDLGPPVTSNVTSPQEAGAALRARIGDDNLYDIELYEAARRIVGRYSPT